MQWVTALRELKKLVEMFIYTGELHIKNQPKHRYEISQRTLTGSIFGCRTKRIPILPDRTVQALAVLRKRRTVTVQAFKRQVGFGKEDQTENPPRGQRAATSGGTGL